MTQSSGTGLVNEAQDYFPQVSDLIAKTNDWIVSNKGLIALNSFFITQIKQALEKRVAGYQLVESISKEEQLLTSGAEPERSR